MRPVDEASLLRHWGRRTWVAMPEFPGMSDEQPTVIESYEVLGYRNKVAIPATFIVDRGVIVWEHRSEGIADRPATAEVLQALREVIADA